jgi:hypothetical protein
MSAERPTDPTAASQVRHLRRTMDAVVDRATASPDGWAELRTRVLGGDSTPPLAVVPSRRGTRPLLVAAALVVVAAIGAALVVVQQRRDEGRVRTTEAPAGSPGGWYIPRDLPKGWKPLSVSGGPETIPCPCRSAIWREPDGAGWVWFRTEQQPEGLPSNDGGEGDDAGDPTVNLGRGVEARFLEGNLADADWALSWDDEGQTASVKASGVSRDDAVAIASALVADPGRRDLPSGNVTLDRSDDTSSSEDLHEASVTVEYRRPDGGSITYALESSNRFHEFSPHEDWKSASLPGQDLPVDVQVEQVYTGPSHGYRPFTSYRGIWPGASVHSPLNANIRAGKFSPDAEQTATLVASLRPATLEEWRAFVRRTPTHEAPLLEVSSIADLAQPGAAPAEPSAKAAVTAAATATGDVGSLRSEATYDSGDEPPTHLSGEIDGTDYTSTFRRTGPDGKESVTTVTVIGSTRWEEHDGKVTKSDSPPEENNAPFPQASEAVVKAALTGSDVTDLGTETVRGHDAQHYRIKLTSRSTAALQALDPSALSRFELEYPDGVVGLDVWVADDLIHRIAVRSDWESGEGSTIEFYDFGADITIRPPS